MVYLTESDTWFTWTTKKHRIHKDLIQISTVISWSCTPYTRISVLFPRTVPGRADKFTNFTSIHNLAAELAFALDKIHFLLINHCNLINHSDSNPSYQTPSENRNNQLEICPLKILMHCSKWPPNQQYQMQKNVTISKHPIILFCLWVQFLKVKRFLDQIHVLAWQDNSVHVMFSPSQSADKMLVNLPLLAKSTRDNKSNSRNWPNTEWLNLKTGIVV